MSTKTLNVTWDDHLQNLSGLFQDLYENKKLCDVTLYCAGGSLLKAHKIVLSACSPYFSKIFQDIDIKHPVIILKGVTYEEMHQLLEFMYKGSINILEQDLACLIQAGSYLEIKGMNAKNIPSNIKTSLKRTNTEEITSSTKKLKDEGSSGSLVTPTTQTSGPTPTPTSSQTLRRETRFKGQKRVDVRFRSSPTISAMTSGGSGAGGSGKKKEDATPGTPGVSGTPGGPGEGKGKNRNSLSNKKSVAAIAPVVDKKPQPSTDELKPVKSPELLPLTTTRDSREREREEGDGGSVSNLVIKDVYSTGEDVDVLQQVNDEIKPDSGSKEKEKEEDEDDDVYSELEDENLVFPDVDFREADGEIVTQSDDEAIQKTSINVNAYMECSYCSMTFKNDNDLFCHEKVHTEKKPFKCDFCDTFFQRSSHLARHRRKHIGDRPYECAQCGKAFARSDKLRTHCRQVHDDDYKPPPHLKKKYEFVEFTGDLLLEKKGRGRPRKFPMRVETPRPPLTDGQKRARGRPRKMSCPAPGEPVENYDITNLPFGDFSYLTEAIQQQAAHAQAQQQQQSQDAEAETTYHDISITPVAATTTSLNTSTTTNISATDTQTTVIGTQTTVTTLTTSNNSSNEIVVIPTNANPILKSNELITNIRQIGECTIQPVSK